MSVIKDYKINECELVLYDTIEAIHNMFYEIFPDDVEQKLKELEALLLSHVRYEEKEFQDVDIIKEDLISRTTYDI